MNKILILSLLSVPLGAMPPIDKLPWVKTDDKQALNYIAPYLPEKDLVIVEAGVCDAEDTVCMKKRWPISVIHGFEAYPVHYALAKKNLVHVSGVHLYPCALFNKVDTITFYVSSKVPTASSLLMDNLDNIHIPRDILAGHDGKNYQDKPITVACTTIDHWAQQNQIAKVDFIWLDTEGVELEILKHATATLATVKVVYTEVNFREFRVGMTQFAQLYDFLQSQGFALKHIWGRSDWQANAVFVKLMEH